MGCAPVLTSSSRGGAGIVDMRTGLRTFLPRGTEYGTYAQTLQRDGFMRMMGRQVLDMCVCIRVLN